MPTQRRHSRPFAFPFEPPKPAVRVCDHPGCDSEGAYRAPRSREALDSYYWFCLDHVRDYNARWDYYAGMPPDEIERQLRNDIGWQRPTWRFGTMAKGTRPFHFDVHDPFDVGAEPAPRPKREATEEEKALAVFELAPPVTLKAIKARFKELVKRYHPDANGGDKGAEERLRAVLSAYHVLRRIHAPVP